MFSLCSVGSMSVPLYHVNMDSSAGRVVGDGGRVHYTHAAAEASYDCARF